MLHTLKNLIGSHILATDGDVGRHSGFLHQVPVKLFYTLKISSLGLLRGCKPHFDQLFIADPAELIEFSIISYACVCFDYEADRKAALAELVAYDQEIGL